MCFSFRIVSAQINQIRQDGYKVSVHSVVTSDGYVLELHRLGANATNPANRTGKPILLMHGLLESSHGWIALGPNHSLGTIQICTYNCVSHISSSSELVIDHKRFATPLLIFQIVPFSIRSARQGLRRVAGQCPRYETITEAQRSHPVRQRSSAILVVYVARNRRVRCARVHRLHTESHAVAATGLRGLLAGNGGLLHHGLAAARVQRQNIEYDCAGTGRLPRTLAQQTAQPIE